MATFYHKTLGFYYNLYPKNIVVGTRYGITLVYFYTVYAHFHQRTHRLISGINMCYLSYFVTTPKGTVSILM